MSQNILSGSKWCTDVDLVIGNLNAHIWFYSFNQQHQSLYMCMYMNTHMHFFPETLTFQPCPNNFHQFACEIWCVLLLLICWHSALCIIVGKIFKTWNDNQSLQRYLAQHCNEFTGDNLLIIMAFVEVFRRRPQWAPLCSSFREVWERLVVVLSLRYNSRFKSMTYFFWTDEHKVGESAWFLAGHL